MSAWSRRPFVMSRTKQPSFCKKLGCFVRVEAGGQKLSFLEKLSFSLYLEAVGTVDFGVEAQDGVDLDGELAGCGPLRCGRGWRRGRPGARRCVRRAGSGVRR